MKMQEANKPSLLQIKPFLLIFHILIALECAAERKGDKANDIDRWVLHLYFFYCTRILSRRSWVEQILFRCKKLKFHFVVNYLHVSYMGLNEGSVETLNFPHYNRLLARHAITNDFHCTFERVIFSVTKPNCLYRCWKLMHCILK